MIGEITPLVKRVSLETWIKAAMAHLLGATASAALLGFVLGSVGAMLRLSRIPHASWWTGFVMFVLALWEVRLLPWPLPTLHRQTPRWFRREFSPTFSGLLWGVDLGQGWTTHIVFAAYYGLVGWALMRSDPLIGTLTMAAYGFGRGLPVLVIGLIELRSRDQTTIPRLPHWQQLFTQLNAFLLAFVGGWLLFTRL